MSTDTQTLSSLVCSTPSVLYSCGFLAAVIISDIRAQPEACVVPRPHRSAEFNLTGRCCLWERADQSCNQGITHQCLMIKLAFFLFLYFCISSKHFFLGLIIFFSNYLSLFFDFYSLSLSFQVR